MYLQKTFHPNTKLATKESLFISPEIPVYPEKRYLKTGKHSRKLNISAVISILYSHSSGKRGIGAGAVDHSILSRGVQIAKSASVSHCILLQGAQVGEGAKLEYCIVDRGSIISPGRGLTGFSTYPMYVAKNSVI